MGIAGGMGAMNCRLYGTGETKVSVRKWYEMEDVTFEEAYARLESAVAALQDGQMSLEEALRHFEEGMRLAQYCNELLQKAELRVQQLGVDGDGTIVVQPLELS